MVDISRKDTCLNNYKLQYAFDRWVDWLIDWLWNGARILNKPKETFVPTQLTMCHEEYRKFDGISHKICLF